MSKLKTDTWMPFYIGDYLADTIGLDYAEHGAYILAMFAYWRKGEALTDQEMKKTVREHYEIVTSFFDKKDDFWHHKRIDQEIDRTKQISKSLSTRGKAGASKRWQNDGQIMQQPCNGHDLSCNGHELANAQAMLGDAQSQSQSQSQLHTQQHSKNIMAVRPKNLSEKVWNDFLALRRSKKAPLTQTAFERIESEVAKAGWSLENALRECCSRGWQAFKAEWVLKSKNGGSHEPSAEDIEATINRNTNAIKRHIATRNGQQVTQPDSLCLPETLGQPDDNDPFDALVGEPE